MMKNKMLFAALLALVLLAAPTPLLTLRHRMLRHCSSRSSLEKRYGC